MRLDVALAARYQISRRKAREHIAAGHVLVNRRRVAVASRDVSERDELTLVEPIDLRILRETEEWVAVDKPAAIPTQPARDRDRTSLEDLLRAKYRQIFPVHRLDTPTTGVVLFARTREAAARLSALFASGEVRKVYVAVAEGRIEHDLTIDAPVRGKAALTIVRPRRSATHGTLVEVEIRTGRTHQIRVHLAAAGHPVAGDRRYGSAVNAPRLMLHAWRLEHPTVGTVEAPIPPEFV